MPLSGFPLLNHVNVWKKDVLGCPALLWINTALQVGPGRVPFRSSGLVVTPSKINKWVCLGGISPGNQWSYGPLLIYNWFFGTHLHWSGLYFFLWFLLMWEDRPSLVNFPTTSPQRATWKWSKLALTCCVFYFVFLVSLTSQLYRDYWWTLVRIALKMNQWGFPWNVSQGLCFRCSLWKICRRSPHHPLQVLGSFHRPKLQRTLPQTSLGWFWTWDSF